MKKDSASSTSRRCKCSARPPRGRRLWAWRPASVWSPSVAPAGTPAAVLARLNAEINKALALPDAAQQPAIEGALPMPTTPQAFGDLIKREIPRWAEVVKAGNVKPD